MSLISPPDAPTQSTASVNGAGTPSGRRRGLLARLAPWASIIAIILVWYLAAVTGFVSPRTLPGPDRTAATAWEMLLDGSLPSSMWVSTLRVVAGSVLGIALGVLLGAVAGLSTIGRNVIDRPMQMVKAIPFTALVPLFILWFGIGEAPKVLLVALGVAVPMYLNTFGGIRDVDRKLVEVATVYHLPPRRIALKVLVPGALPSILTGLRYALGLAWVALIVAEQVNADSGIGFLLTNARTYTRTDIMLVCISLYALLGLLTDLLVRALEKRLLVWRRGFESL